VAEDDTEVPESSAARRVSRVPQKVERNRSPLAPIALVVAVIAVGVAVWALLSVPKPTATVEHQLSGDPKARVCNAGQLVATAVQLQTNANVGEEPAAVEAVAGNARLSMLGGGEYLLSQISGDTPEDVADVARLFGSTLQVIGMNALAGVDNADPAQADRIQVAETNRNKLNQLCT
jgi:hypothetical protein